jgi:hypothetical protein
MSTAWPCSTIGRCSVLSLDVYLLSSVRPRTGDRIPPRERIRWTYAVLLCPRGSLRSPLNFTGTRRVACRSRRAGSSVSSSYLYISLSTFRGVPACHFYPMLWHRTVYLPCAPSVLQLCLVGIYGADVGECHLSIIILSWMSRHFNFLLVLFFNLPLLACTSFTSQFMSSLTTRMLFWLALNFFGLVHNYMQCLIHNLYPNSDTTETQTLQQIISVLLLKLPVSQAQTSDGCRNLVPLSLNTVYNSLPDQGTHCFLPEALTCWLTGCST